jgi:hypothetical protein
VPLSAHAGPPPPPPRCPLRPAARRRCRDEDPAAPARRAARGRVVGLGDGPTRAGPHSRHPQPDPRPHRTRRRGPQPCRPDKDQLGEPGQPDGPARTRPACAVRTDGTHLLAPGCLRDTGHSIGEIVAKTGIARTSLYRHLPPRPAVQLTEAPNTEERATLCRPTGLVDDDDRAVPTRPGGRSGRRQVWFVVEADGRNDQAPVVVLSRHTPSGQRKQRSSRPAAGRRRGNPARSWKCAAQTRS